MSVRGFYANKNILINGVTEFLGHLSTVLAYLNLLQAKSFSRKFSEQYQTLVPSTSSSEARYLFSLIHSKLFTSYQEGSSSLERFKREVASSPCFDRLRRSSKKFEEFLQSKVVLIPGSTVSQIYRVSILIYFFS